MNMKRSNEMSMPAAPRVDGLPPSPTAKENSGDPPKVQREKLFDCEGVQMLGSVVQNMRELQEFAARPDDVLIASYPKAGTTWMIEIADCVRRGGVTEELLSLPSHKRAPFLETFDEFSSGIRDLNSMASPRLVKTHLPIQFIPQSFWNNRCKVIYVARNAKDVLVSYYFFHQMSLDMPEPGQWEEFFDSFLSGRLAWGSWFDHVLGWWDNREKHQVLYVFYEDIKQDPLREVERVARYLDKPMDRSVMADIVAHTSFTKMKDNPMTNYKDVPSILFNHEISPFMRTGRTGDWKNHFTVAENERFDEEYQGRMAKTSLRFRTQL